MNSQSETSGTGVPVAMNVLTVAQATVAPFEFRMLSSEDAQEIFRSAATAGKVSTTDDTLTAKAVGPLERGLRGVNDAPGREAMLRVSVDAARQEGFLEGEREGRSALRAELELQANLQVARERQLVAEAVEQFRGTRDRYFTEVEQEVVKLALAIAARVLHREAQLDPLLLAGAVRVALERMADRSGVVLRVAGGDVEAWERGLLSIQPHERPSVVEDAQMQRGECVLETTMGTVELGVKVQLEEIEKGFFDLLNHRPTE
jgi:flagellar assembly protein FliH